jgi:hypothetical protein
MQLQYVHNFICILRIIVCYLTIPLTCISRMCIILPAYCWLFCVICESIFFYIHQKLLHRLCDIRHNDQLSCCRVSCSIMEYFPLLLVVCRNAHVLFTPCVFAWVWWWLCFVFLPLMYPMLPFFFWIVRISIVHVHSINYSVSPIANMSSTEQDSGFNIVPYETRNDLDLENPYD